MKEYKKFAAFILSNGRPDNIKTIETIKKLGYTGRVVILIDNLDGTKDEYIRRYGDIVHVFDKPAIGKEIDLCDNFQELKAVTYARAAVFKAAEELGIKYFIVLDDDYTTFRYRYLRNLEYNPQLIFNLDDVFAAMLKFYINTPTLSIALSQGGDFIGGSLSNNAQRVTLLRKCMNSFICSTDRPFKFVGTINEDTNTYVILGTRGHLFFTTNQVSLLQTSTQVSEGGLTGIYKAYGTYVKSFYTVMNHPSGCRVSVIHSTNKRIHHKVKWNNTVPKILSEDLKKAV